MLIVIFSILVAVRLGAIALSWNISNFDLESYRIIGSANLEGLHIYTPEFSSRYPYFPFFVYIEGLAMTLQQFSIHYVLVIKLFLIVFEMGICYLVYRLTKNNTYLAFLYALNPVSIFISSYHGQFDAIPVFFILLAMVLLEKRREAAALSAYSFAILTKTWPILLLVPFAETLRKKRYLLLIPLFPLLTTALYALLYRAPFMSIVSTVEGYRGTFGWWGIGYLYKLITGIDTPHGTRFMRIIFFISFIVFSLLIRKRPIGTQILLLLLFFYSFTFAFAPQYLLWVIPFLLIERPKFWRQFILMTSAYVWFLPSLTLLMWGVYVLYFVYLLHSCAKQ